MRRFLTTLSAVLLIMLSPVDAGAQDGAEAVVAKSWRSTTPARAYDLAFFPDEGTDGSTGRMTFAFSDSPTVRVIRYALETPSLGTWRLYRLDDEPRRPLALVTIVTNGLRACWIPDASSAERAGPPEEWPKSTDGWVCDGLLPVDDGLMITIPRRLDRE